MGIQDELRIDGRFGSSAPCGTLALAGTRSSSANVDFGKISFLSSENEISDSIYTYNIYIYTHDTRMIVWESSWIP